MSLLAFRFTSRFIAKCGFLLAMAYMAAVRVQAASWTNNADPEDFHIEITGSAWILHTSGTIQSGGTPVDLRTDLGVEQNQPTFVGKFVWKPARKHRVIVEGTPFTLDGRNTVERAITYRGQTFNVSETVVSDASLTYLFAGYQYDVVSRPAGHLGFLVGGTYVDTTGALRGLQSGIVASKSETLGLPLAGAEFRVSPVPGHRVFEINGEVKGMDVGDYGHFLQAALNAGIRVGLVTLEGGYRILDADIHGSGGSQNGVNPTFRGPVASLIFRY